MTEIWWWSTVVAVVLFAGWQVGALGGARRRRRRAATFARRAGLPAVSPELVRRVARRQRFVFAGAVLGLAACALVDLWLIPVYAGLALGAVADAVSRPGPAPGAPRVAHTTSSRLRDYVPAWLLGATAAAAGCPLVLALLWLFAPQAARDPMDVSPVPDSPVGWLVLAAAAGLAGSLAVARVIVGRRQPAGTPDELAVDDALRAQAVRDVLQVSAVVSLAVTWLLATAVTDRDGTGPARQLAGWLPVALLVALPVVGTVHEFTSGPKHWRARLRREPVAA